MRFLSFLKENVLYIIWFMINLALGWLVLGANLTALWLVCVIYAFSIGIALCPLGEWLLRLIEGCRQVSTRREQEYLHPIFEEVYENAKQVKPELNNNIKLYIVDEMYVNAYAIGRKTIAVTQGAIETFSQEELKGIIAHEFGHMAYGHTKALLLTVIGNMLFTCIVVFLRIIMMIIQVLTCAFSGGNGIISTILNIMFKTSFELSLFVFINLGEIILAMNSRKNEYKADEFALEAGFGEELKESLYILQKISMQGKMSLSERIKASHPHTAKRIEHLEQLSEGALSLEMQY